MKKALAFVLAAALTVGLAACSNTEQNPDSAASGAPTSGAPASSGQDTPSGPVANKDKPLVWFNRQPSNSTTGELDMAALSFNEDTYYVGFDANQGAELQGTMVKQYIEENIDTIDRNGGVTFDDRADSEEIENLIETLDSQGFTAEPQAVETSENAEPSPAEVDGLCISMPASLFSETALQNLKDITAAKGSLIRKALGVEELPIEVGETKVSFPWFAGTPAPEEVKAYDHFICALCEMARNQKRITAKERDTGTDKYAFRCFLLRLGFIGPEYKQERKILLRNLTGSSAFKAVPQKEVADDAASE